MTSARPPRQEELHAAGPSANAASVRIDVAALQAILTAASAAAPREACGLLLGGREGEAAVVVAAPETGNVAANPARAFEMDPGEVVALHGVAAARGLAVIGAWHSHPAGQASPSAEDLAAAWPGHALLIVAGGRARAFVPTPEGARVLPMTEADVAGWAPPPPSRTLSAMGQAPSDPSDIAALARGVVGGERASLARAITLVESVRPADAARARDLLAAVAALRVAAGNGAPAPAHRVGISGVPGVGKSTLIDALGSRLVERGHRVAVLAVDPSSTLSGGSILGDKSRMARLARSDAAFIRPSPNAASLGGVARRTRETMALVEAAGYDVVLVETVGVGQSEVAVAGMVDTFVVLLLPGAGDELQGIKKGILELADVLAVNKCDGDNLARARAAVSDHAAALRYLRARDEAWTPRALAVSAATGEGLDALWDAVEAHRAALLESGLFDARREEQQVRWVWARIEEGLLDAFRRDAVVQATLPALLARVKRGEEPASHAADELLRRFLRTD